MRYNGYMEQKTRTVGIRLSNDLYDRIKRVADQEKRSLNGQIALCLERCLNERNVMTVSSTAPPTDAPKEC
jgi:hypothetical protein